MCQGLSLPGWGDTPVEQRDPDRAPRKEGKRQKTPKANSWPSTQGERLGREKRWQPLAGAVSFQPSSATTQHHPLPHHPPLPRPRLRQQQLRAGGSAHARTETQLKKVEYGLTKNKRPVSCLPLGYARWQRGGQGWWHPGRSPLFFLPPTAPLK